MCVRFRGIDAGRCPFFSALNPCGAFNHSDRKCVRPRPISAGRWRKIRPLNPTESRFADEGGQVLYDQYIDLLTPDESGDAAVLTLDTAAAQTVAAGGIAVFSVDMSSVDSLLNYSVQQTCGSNTVVGILTGYYDVRYGFEETMQRTITNAGGTVRTEYFAFADEDNFGYVAVYNPGSAAVDTTVTLKS